MRLRLRPSLYRALDFRDRSARLIIKQFVDVRERDDVGRPTSAEVEPIPLAGKHILWLLLKVFAYGLEIDERGDAECAELRRVTDARELEESRGLRKKASMSVMSRA